MNSYRQPSRAEWHANQKASQQSMHCYEDVLSKSDEQSNAEAAQENEYVNIMAAKNQQSNTEVAQEYEYVNAITAKNQQSNTEGAQESEYVNATVAKKVEEETKPNKNWNKTLIIAITALVMALIMMGVFFGMFIQLSNQQTAAISAMNRTMFQLADENQDLNTQLQAQLQLQNDELEVQKNQINDLQNETFDLRSNDEDLYNKTRNLAQGYEELEDGWVTPFNGFQYKYITSGHNWYEARTFCYEKGGDLASLGIWDIEIRRILKEALNINSDVWIGLNDIDSDGSWYWVPSYGSNSGYRATEATALWYHGQPYNSSSYNCAILLIPELSAYSRPCDKNYYVLCKKRA